MDRLRKSLILLAVIAVPAAAHSTFAPEEELCFASGSATFKLSPKASSPDIRVKIDNAAPRPDLRMQLVDRPEIADFVLADDYGATPGNACQSPAPMKVIKVDNETRDAGHHRQPQRRRHARPTTGSTCIRCGSRTMTSPHCSPRSGRRNRGSSSPNIARALLSLR